MFTGKSPHQLTANLYPRNELECDFIITAHTIYTQCETTLTLMYRHQIAFLRKKTRNFTHKFSESCTRVCILGNLPAQARPAKISAVRCAERLSVSRQLRFTTTLLERPSHKHTKRTIHTRARRVGNKTHHTGN